MTKSAAASPAKPDPKKSPTKKGFFSFLHSKTKHWKHLKERTVVIARNEAGKLGLLVQGGLEFDVLPYISLDALPPVCEEGEIHSGDQLISIDGTSVVGLKHPQVVEILQRTGQKVKLVVISGSKKRKLSDLQAASQSKLPQDALDLQKQLKAVASHEDGTGSDLITKLVKIQLQNGSPGITLGPSPGEGRLPQMLTTNPDVKYLTNDRLDKGDAIIAVNDINVVPLSSEEIQNALQTNTDSITVAAVSWKSIDVAPTVVEIMGIENPDVDIRAAQTDIRDALYTSTVPYTTRAPRDGEEDGETYHFVSTVEFKEMVQEDRFLEWGDRDGFLYGTVKDAHDEASASPAKPVKRKSALLDSLAASAAARKVEAAKQARSPNGGTSVRRRGSKSFEGGTRKTYVLERSSGEEHFGFVIEGHADGVKVEAIREGSVASNAGLKVGSTVTRLQDIDLEYSIPSKVDKVLQVVKGKDLKLNIEVLEPATEETNHETSRAVKEAMEANDVEVKAAEQTKPGVTKLLIAGAGLAAVSAAGYFFLLNE